MQGFIRAVVRLGVMGSVMAAVLTASIVAGLATTTAVALGIVLAGLVGLIGVARRPRAPQQPGAPTFGNPALMPADRPSGTESAVPTAQPAADPNVIPTRSHATAVEAMAPRATAPLDPEANIPRWRRKSLLEARFSDPTRQMPSYRIPMRFIQDAGPDADLRIVRYAVVSVLDRPDEVLGIQVSDLAKGDEVQVLGASGSFLEVLCPSGDQGWIHRTTVGQPDSSTPAERRTVVASEADDALTALLTARGLI